MNTRDLSPSTAQHINRWRRQEDEEASAAIKKAEQEKNRIEREKQKLER